MGAVEAGSLSLLPVPVTVSATRSASDSLSQRGGGVALGAAPHPSPVVAQPAWRSPGGRRGVGAQGERLALTSRLSVSVPEEAEDPACIPIFWVSKWVDYSDKYGLGRCPPGGPAARARPREPLTCFRLTPVLAVGSSSALLSPAQASQCPPLPARLLRCLSPAARVPAV